MDDRKTNEFDAEGKIIKRITANALPELMEPIYDK